MTPTRVASILLWIGLLLSTQAAFGFTAIYAFGDSLTDTTHHLATGSSYWMGRFSNGPLWVEYLSPLLGFPYNPANNLAWAGSTASSGSITPSLLTQVNSFSAPANAGSALFVTWSGGNDVINNLPAGTNASWNDVIVSAVNSISNAVIILYGKGARALVVPNLPDIGKTPRLRNGYSPAYQEYITTQSIQFNSRLASTMNAIRQAKPALQLFDLDVFGKMSFIITNLATYGFTVATNDALDDPALTDKSFTGPGSNYVFWDSIHPTTKSHSLVANWFFETLAATQQVAITLSGPPGTFNLTLHNLETARTYTVQRSTGLPAWSDAATFKATNGSQIFPQALTADPEILFRVRY